MFRIYARGWCAGENFEADAVAEGIDGDLPASAWQELGQDLLSRLDRKATMSDLIGNDSDGQPTSRPTCGAYSAI